MKPASTSLVAILILIPFLYLAGYAGVFAMADPAKKAPAFGSTGPSIRVYPNQINIHTHDHPVAKAAVKVFEPAMKLHGRISGRSIYVSASEFG